MIPTIDALYWLPREDVPDDLLRQATAVSAWDEDEEIQGYETKGDLIGLPRSLARAFFKPSEVKWEFAKGSEIVVPKCPTPRSELQGEFWTDVLKAVSSRTDTMAQASTGTGKTVCAMYCVSHIKRTTLVVVHKGNLATQWVREFVDKCGFAEEDVGFVGDGRKDWEGRPVCVALLQTLRRDAMPEAFWDHFGFAVFDEVHRAPAAKSSLVLRRLKSARRLALTATPVRRDGLDKLLTVHLGPIRVSAKLGAMPMKVHVFEYLNPIPWVRVFDPEEGRYVERQQWPIVYRKNEWGQWEEDRMATRGKVQQILENDPVRQQISLGILRQAWNLKRRGIMVAERIEHLETMRDMAIDAGIPAEEMGMFTAEATMDVKVHEYEEVPISDKRRQNEAKRKGIPFFETKATERKVKLDDYGEKIFRIERKRQKQDRDDLDDMLKEKRFVFATYGMLTEGIDVPAWDFGHDMVGRSEATQLIGRIRREFPDKQMPIWFTLNDANCPMAANWLRSRMNDYRTSGGVTITEFYAEEGKWKKAA